MDTYRSKIVLSGNVLEVYYYQEDIKHNFKRFDLTNKKIPDETLNKMLSNKEDVPKWVKKDKKNTPDCSQEQEKESDIETKKRSLLRSKIRLRRLINANATELDKFVTLTFRKNITDVTKANQKFEKFKKRLKYRLKKDDKNFDLKYIAVIEFQKRGAVHYHCLFNISYIKNEQLQKIWRNGFVRINKIDDVDNVGAYVVKYMSDDIEKYSEQLGSDHKRYLHSRGNLKEPIIVKDDAEVAEILADLDDSDIAYESEYDTDYFGEVHYRQYKC